MLLELLLQEVMVGRHSRETVPILGQHYRDVPSSHEIPYPVYPRAFEARPALSWARYLLKDFVPFLGCIFPQRL